MPAMSLSRKAETPPVNLKVAMLFRSWSASPGMKPAQTMATRMACSWKQGHAQRLTENLFQFRLWIDHRLKPFAAPQIGMDHVALDRAWPHDRDLDHQVVKGPRLDARKHRHLRTALDLEGAERVGLTDH